MEGMGMKWQKKLNKKELKHVKEWCGNSLRGLKNNIENGSKELPCYECMLIARKLKLID